jgi:superfamily II DNA or RNA helicase
MKLEEITTGVSVTGLAARGLAEVVSVDWLGEDYLHVFFRSERGPEERILTRSDEARLEAARAVRPFSFAAGADDFRLAAEAKRIRLAHLFDPYLALTSSAIEALPHQITAVYGEMLTRQPLRFLLADDPGAGKTIMAGLLIKELILRGDLKRCLIVAPGSLVEQWQYELQEKFDLRFDVVSRQMIDAAYHGNPFREHDRLILRLDMASRSDDMQALIEASTDFDLVIVDEAHRMSASYFGNEVKRTKRFLFGRNLGQNARHLLLMTATPHNGKEEDFQLFLSLLDHDRFEGRPRDGMRAVQPADLMRRLVKEELYWFDGRPLFPERRAYTVSYKLSAAEAELYSLVTDYVREEMNRADRVEGAARNNVGFALMSLQRRLASSPRAIWVSLKRRRERLQARLEEEQIRARGQLSQVLRGPLRDLDAEDLEEMPDEELEALENEAIDTASTARTLDELAAEIASLKDLEDRAYRLCRTGEDTKWSQLAQILDQPPVHDPDTGRQKKILIFTEPRDTLDFLQEKITARLGDPEAVKVIHGGVPRQQRRAAVAAFNDDPHVRVLIANDAAGEGVNLQRGAHLMVNYDLPWNPNRLEQRFGRIHRIGQTEVCHLWNLVAGETREGAVYQRLLEKLEEARKSLGGKVYDVLGELFEDARLQDLLFEAVRYGEREDTRARLFKVVEGAVDRDRLTELTKRAQLSSESLSPSRVEELRIEMERAAAQRLQPHYVRAFFMEAFRRQGGIIDAREEGRWEVTRVPARVRLHDHAAGSGDPVLERYSRVCFDKVFRKPTAQDADAALIAPGHSLLEAVTDLTIEELGSALREGAILVDENDAAQEPKLLIMAEHAIRDGRESPSGGARVISQQLQFVYLMPDGSARIAGLAPYLDLRAPTPDERAVTDTFIEAEWLTGDLNAKAVKFAATTLVPEHLESVRERRLAHLRKVEAEVRERLSREIRHWDARANKHRGQIMAGRDETLALRKAEARANELGQRLEMRLAELESERDIAALPPRVLGGALVVPMGLIAAHLAPSKPDGFAEQTGEIELIAMEAVKAAEARAGRRPVDVSKFNRGWDIESFTPDGRMLLLEVKGRIVDGRDVIVTRNEMLKARNAGAQYHLVLVQVEGGFAHQPAYIADPARHFWYEGDFKDTCRHYAVSDLLKVSTADPLT